MNITNIPSLLGKLFNEITEEMTKDIRKQIVAKHGELRSHT